MVRAIFGAKARLQPVYGRARGRPDWDVTDKGPMEEPLGIVVDYNGDGSVKLHQRKYIEKLIEGFMPDGPLSKAQGNSPRSTDGGPTMQSGSHDAGLATVTYPMIDP